MASKLKELCLPIYRRVAYLGRGRWCPICQSHASRFEVFGFVPREDARCPYCRALERHRLFWLYLQRRTHFFQQPVSCRMLHVAPEKVFEKRFRRLLGAGYITADLSAEGVDVAMDVTEMPFADESFDFIYCSHVLEHVPDDRKAMREFARVLVKGGIAVLLVPITVEVTVEDPSITDPAERLRLFGQHNHVRRYGRDYSSRLEEAGFSVEVVEPHSFLSRDEMEVMAITPPAGEIYVCRT